MEIGKDEVVMPMSMLTTDQLESRMYDLIREKRRMQSAPAPRDERSLSRLWWWIKNIQDELIRRHGVEVREAMDNIEALHAVQRFNIAKDRRHITSDLIDGFVQPYFTPSRRTFYENEVVALRKRHRE